MIRGHRHAVIAGPCCGLVFGGLVRGGGEQVIVHGLPRAVWLVRAT